MSKLNHLKTEHHNQDFGLVWVTTAIMGVIFSWFLFEPYSLLKIITAL